MRLKLDENLGAREQALFRAAGHDVETARSERLSGTSDDSIYEACCLEGRCLVTLDLDFADPLRFPARRCAGIIVLRTHKSMTSSILKTLVEHSLEGMQSMKMRAICGSWN